jgi:hypothetical protein
MKTTITIGKEEDGTIEWQRHYWKEKDYVKSETGIAQPTEKELSNFKKGKDRA